MQWLSVLERFRLIYGLIVFIDLVVSAHLYLLGNLGWVVDANIILARFARALNLLDVVLHLLGLLPFL